MSDSLNKAVKDARHNKEWRAEYMMHMANYWDNIEQGKELGIELGNATSLVNYVTKCMNKCDFSLEETLDMLGETMEDYLKAKEMVEQTISQV